MNTQQALVTNFKSFAIDNTECRKLCMALINADSEDEVKRILESKGLWNVPKYWRNLDDNENNASIIGAQQNRADSALVEKIINSIDAKLTGECKARGINPESTDKSPKDIRHAVAQFIEEHSSPEKDSTGRVINWDISKRTEAAQHITVAATGEKSSPCFTICDNGEGQTPDKIPSTFMSLMKSNKLRIPFVQGKFNMGGTGVLRFCGECSIELILTRKDPRILEVMKNSGETVSEKDYNWSLTIVRKNEPQQNERSSVWRYLAPLETKEKPYKGNVLNFKAENLKIFPNKNEAYLREATHGSLIKLYNYKIKGRSHILRSDGLLRKLEILLPDPALPVRLHECRKGYSGKGEASFANNMIGISARLSDAINDRPEKSPIESGYKLSCPLRIVGEDLSATIYVFKQDWDSEKCRLTDRSATYRDNDQGVLFTVNGQCHGSLPISFFRTNKVKLSELSKSLLVILDCTKLSRAISEQLFMNSRDRLNKDSDIFREIDKELSHALKKNSALTKLQNQRRAEKKSRAIENSKPLEDTLRNIFKNSPALAKMFLKGERLSNPYKPKLAGIEEAQYIGKPYPTYFHIKGFKDKVCKKNVHRNGRCRMQFETDVVNEYFSRLEKRGEISLNIISEDDSLSPLSTFSGPSMDNGKATVTFPLPDGVEINDTLRFRCEVTDPTQIEPFTSEFVVNILPDRTTETRESRKSKNEKHPNKDGNDTDKPSGIKLPEVLCVEKENWGIMIWMKKLLWSFYRMMKTQSKMAKLSMIFTSTLTTFT